MESIPSHDQCIQYLRDAGATQELIDHSEAVCRLSLSIAEMIMETNIDLVEAGALLHDIGRTRTQGFDHGIVGAEIAKELELPEDIQKIILNHVGAGITDEDAEDLGLPDGNYIPQTIEEKIVAHADNLIDDTRRRGVEDYIRKFVEEEDYRIARRIINLHNKLSEMAGMDIDQVNLE